MIFAVCAVFTVTSSCLIPQASARCRSLGTGSCLPEWHHRYRSCYLVTHTKTNWHSAREKCEQFGGFLAVPRSIEENDFILTLMSHDTAVWIDCNDIDREGEWECKEDGMKVNFRMWGPDEPSADDGEDCAVLTLRHSILRNNKWFDRYCPDLNYAVCKYNQKPVN